ncbi:MAG: hypothetical protein IJ819_00095 [Clostridiales bacterium]|nr:hypothetical protein [Clostridiales bacterium]
MATLTPNFGLIVPEATDTVAQVRADYASNLNTIDENLGGGGGGGGGGGNVYGTFIDTNHVIQASTMYQADLTYVATEDCVVFCEIVAASNNSAYIAIDGKNVEYLYSEGGKQSRKPSVFLRKGQTLTAHSSVSDWNAYYTVYGLIQGTESIFTPIIYSDNERMIGIWRDNKPLYQRSFAFTISVTSGQTATIATLTDYENIISLDGWFNENNVFYSLNDYSARLTVNASGQLQFRCASGSSWNGSGYITVRYTKTTDVAGSGNWNTDGVPTVHYSTSEQVIGTWIDGKPLYQITADFGAEITVNSNTWTNTTIPTTDKKAIISAVGTNGSGTCWNFISANCDSGSYVQVYHTRSAAITLQTMTIQYTKTTD